MDVIDPLDVQNAIERLVEETNEKLILVSPYFKPWPKLTQRIEKKLGLASITIMVRGGETETIENTQQFRGAIVHVVHRLHAKLYLNEAQAIVTSMNLNGGSRDSEEVGVLIDRSTDQKHYAKLAKIADELAERAENSFVAPAAKPPLARPSRAGAGPSAERASARRERGTCIRCGVEIARNADKPLCRGCFDEWARYENPDYEEAFCHDCGRPSPTSMIRPLCRACWKAAS